jgi:hypothetical protein
MHPNINNDRKKDVSIFEKSNPGPELAFTELLKNILVREFHHKCGHDFSSSLRKYRKKFVPCVNKLFTCVLSNFE